MAKLRVAIVCDWLVGTGGAERVVLELHKLYPEAPIYTSQYDERSTKWFGDSWFADADVHTLWLQRLPKFLRKFMAPLRALAFSRLDLSAYDLVISSSGAEAKFVKVKASATHICYCHAPTHYYWNRYSQYLENPGLGWFNPLARLGLRLLVGPMRRLDHRAAQRVTYFLTNSLYSAEQIKKYYGREAHVIHPPVDVERFGKHNQPADQRQAFVTAGRQAPYKKTDLAVKAANLANLPLVVIGNGPDHTRLKKLAGRSVTFLKNVNDQQLAEYLGSAKAFIFPGVDDFGIVAVEALAAGTPVIAYAKGGALDYVDKDNGLLFSEAKAEALAKAMAEANGKNFDHGKIASQALAFSAKNFRTKVVQFIAQRVK